MFKKNIRLSFCFCTLLWSCEKEILINPPIHEPRLVLESMFHQFDLTTFSYDPFLIKLTKSAAIMNIDSASTAVVKNAKILLYKNHELFRQLTYDDSLKKYVDFCEAHNSSCIATSIKPITGDIYSIEASAPGFRAVSATDTMPVFVPIDSVSIALNAFFDELQHPLSEINVSFTDLAGQDNFYEIVVGSFDGFYDLGGRLKSNDPIITNEPYYSNLTSVFSTFEFRSLVFSDKLFRGNKTTIKLILKADCENPDRTICNGLYSIQLRSISRTYYQYMSTYYMQLGQRKKGGFYGQEEPVRVYSNVTNGFGLFAGYQASSRKFKITNGKTDFTPNQ